MNYKVEFSKKALKSFFKLSPLVQANILKKMGLLSKNPYAKINNVKKLQAEFDCYRLRVGAYRILYVFVDKRLVIEVINIAHRKEVYK